MAKKKGGNAKQDVCTTYYFGTNFLLVQEKKEDRRN